MVQWQNKSPENGFGKSLHLVSIWLCHTFFAIAPLQGELKGNLKTRNSNDHSETKKYCKKIFSYNDPFDNFRRALFHFHSECHCIPQDFPPCSILFLEIILFHYTKCQFVLLRNSFWACLLPLYSLHCILQLFWHTV